MYPTSFTHNLKKGLLIFLALVLLGLIYPTYQYLTAPDVGISDPAQLNFGLDDTLVENAVRVPASGYLYVYGTPSEVEETEETEETMPASLLAIALEDELLRRVPVELDTSLFRAGEQNYGFYPDFNENAGTLADRFHPAYLDYETNTHTRYDTPSRYSEGIIQVPSRLVDEREWLAYDAQAQDLSQAESSKYFDLENWEIIVHNPYTSETRSIIQAARPVWINDGADLVYIKEDGVYRYNVAVDASERIIEEWNGLNYDAQLAVDAQSSALILTVPGMNAIAVYTFTDSQNGDVIPQGIITTPNMIYSDPVFGPDGTQYAVLATNNFEGNKSAVQIEIRKLLERTTLTKFTPELVAAQPIRLLGWRTKITPFEWR